MQTKDATLAKLVADGHVVGARHSACPACQRIIHEEFLSSQKAMKTSERVSSSDECGEEQDGEIMTWQLQLLCAAKVLLLLCFIYAVVALFFSK